MHKDTAGARCFANAQTEEGRKYVSVLFKLLTTGECPHSQEHLKKSEGMVKNSIGHPVKNNVVPALSRKGHLFYNVIFKK